MKIIVNDANILIDLVELELLPNFFALEFEFFTTSLVFEELEEDQQGTLQQYVESGSLLVYEMTNEQLSEINEIQKTKPALSPQDCSAFYQAQIEEGILVTSDNTLRKFAKSKNQEVHGHLWVFDRMFEAETITGEQAINKLNELCQVINRHLGLPENECQKRIEVWSA
jgi:rRNA-processing protein FCF1|tara:strand:+ start:2032 stop:2538 length:507 start_codon:yes stop_codon:yes gene_type:complete